MEAEELMEDFMQLPISHVRRNVRVTDIVGSSSRAQSPTSVNKTSQ